MRDHLLGYPPVLAALFPAEPSKVQYTPKRERLSSTEEMLRGCRDRQEQEAMPAPAVGVPFREPAYSTEHYAATYVPDGVDLGADDQSLNAFVRADLQEISSEWMHKRLADPRHQQQEWHEGPPPEPGWYLCRHKAPHAFNPDLHLYFDGVDYTKCKFNNVVEDNDPTDDSEWCNVRDAVWRGPRLVGADWPEPEVPSEKDLRLAFELAANRNERAVIAYYGSKPWSIATCPAHERAAAIAAFEAIK